MEAEEAGPGRVRVAQTKEDLAKVTRAAIGDAHVRLSIISFLGNADDENADDEDDASDASSASSVCLSVSLSLSLSLSAGK